MENTVKFQKNGQMWYDTDGNPIQAHAGCIERFEDKWYWYGDSKGKDNLPGQRRVEYIGLMCYSSDNLVNWKNEGFIFKADTENPESPFHLTKVVARPKVIYNDKTKKYVMWWHQDNADYSFAGVGVAVAESPLGPFEVVKIMRPNRFDSRDMTLFKDIDGTAYLICSKEHNRTLGISRLTEDYLNVDGFYTSVLIDQEREAPALCFHEGMYYMVTSGCSGWNPNSALFARCKHVMGQWQLIDNPCEGENYRKTFFGQSAYIFENDGQKYLMLDHFKPYELKNSGYSILPITFKNRDMTITWQDEWRGI